MPQAPLNKRNLFKNSLSQIIIRRSLL